MLKVSRGQLAALLLGTAVALAVANVAARPKHAGDADYGVVSTPGAAEAAPSVPDR